LNEVEKEKKIDSFDIFSVDCHCTSCCLAMDVVGIWLTGIYRAGGVVAPTG
jgi:hypothetical protein